MKTAGVYELLGQPSYKAEPQTLDMSIVSQQYSDQYMFRM